MSFNRNRKEGNVLFNDALNTFYLRLYGLGHIDNKRGVMLLVNEAFSALTKYQNFTGIWLHVSCNRDVASERPVPRVLHISDLCR